MDRRFLPGFDAWFHSQYPHLYPASASSTGLPLFRPFQSTPVLLPPLVPMPPLAPLAPIPILASMPLMAPLTPMPLLALMPPLAPIPLLPMLPHSLFPATSSVPGWGNFQTAGILSSNHPNVSSSSIDHPNSGRAKERMGFSIDDILKSDHAQQPEVNQVSCIPSSSSSAFLTPVSMSRDDEPTTSDNKVDHNDLLAWQHEQLELAFQQSHYPDRNRKSELSQAIGMDENQIGIWFQNRRSRHRKMDHTQKGPGRPSLANPPATCSGVPIPEEEFEQKRREKNEKRNRKHAEKRMEKLKQRGTGTDVTARKSDDEEPRMIKTESDMDQEQGATSSTQSVAEGGASVSGLTGRARSVSSGQNIDLSLRPFCYDDDVTANQRANDSDNSTLIVTPVDTSSILDRSPPLSSILASASETLYIDDVISYGINAPDGNHARSVDDNSGGDPRDRKLSFSISNIIG